MSAAKSEEIKKELAQELARKAVDYGRVLELAAELSKFDTESAAFSVNATIIRRLGRELVSAQETALVEATVDETGRWEIYVASKPLDYEQTFTVRDMSITAARLHCAWLPGR